LRAKKSKNLVGIVGIEAMFSLSHLKQTKVYQEATKEGREEGQQRGKLPAKLDYITLATALDLDMERGREVPEKCRQNLSVIGQFYETNSLPMS
jgi:predicted transposase YdaD